MSSEDVQAPLLTTDNISQNSRSNKTVSTITIPGSVDTSSGANISATPVASTDSGPRFQSNSRGLGRPPVRTRVGIIGTGNYAIALTKRLTLVAGYDVILGSRKPDERRGTLAAARDCMCGVQLTTVSECVQSCDLIFVAIHKEDFQVTLGNFTRQLQGKIVVDVSNREYRYAAQSNAEQLASILPGARVVKAFNSVSAFAMEDMGESGFADSASRVVYVAGNDPAARAEVTALGQTMGFRVMDIGPLSSARWMEDFVLKVFTHWKVPIFLAFGIFNLWSLYIVYIYWIEKPEPAYSWEQIFLKVANKPLCMTAITMLALTYLPGQLASVLQMWRGTKHQRFPKLLDTWLKSRKQLGLVAFFLATVHAIASVLMLSPTYYSSWFHKVTITLPANSTLTSDLVLTPTKAWMTWKGEAACALGVLAFVLMCIVALTSIRSVADSLNWSEWRCVHSQLSYAVLLLSAAHVCVMGGPGWKKRGFPDAFRSITLLSALLPLFVLFLKLVFSLPPLSGHLHRIRRGWERKPATSGHSAPRRREGFVHSLLGCCPCYSGYDVATAGTIQGDYGDITVVVTDTTRSDNIHKDVHDINTFSSSSSSSSCCNNTPKVNFNPNNECVSNKAILTSSSSASLSSSSFSTGCGARDKALGKQIYRGVSLHKNCTCADQRKSDVAFPQSTLCQCSSV